MLAAADWLVGDCQAYDSLIFFFSGYGGQLIEGGDHEHPCGDTLLPVDHAEVGCEPVPISMLMQQAAARQGLCRTSAACLLSFPTNVPSAQIRV